MNPRLLLFAAVLGVIGWLPAQADTPPLVQRTMTWQGVTRTWYEHVPSSYDGSVSVPLVVALHGYSNRAVYFASDSQWCTQADTSNLIAVFPNGGIIVGQDFGWNMFSFDGSAPDDLGFLTAMIAQILTEYQIDPSRVYMVGFSNGGGMATTFAAAHASTLAAFAPVSGGWAESFGVPASALQPNAPMPVWVWRGALEDFHYGSLTLAQQDAAQVQYWANFDGDSPNGVTAVLGGDTTTTYSGGSATVQYTSIAGADHAYQPGTTARLWSEFFSTRVRLPGSAPTPTPTPTPTPSPTPGPSPGSSPPASGATPTVSISADVPDAFEKHLLNGKVRVARANADNSAPLTVLYEVTGTAVPGVHYQPLPGSVVIPAGADSVSIKIKPINDEVADGNKTVRITLLPSADYVPGDLVTARVKVIDKQ